MPVLDAVVSITNPLTWSAIFHLYKSSIHTLAWSLPVPERILGTPGSISLFFQDTKTATLFSRSACTRVRPGIDFSFFFLELFFLTDKELRSRILRMTSHLANRYCNNLQTQPFEHDLFYFSLDFPVSFSFHSASFCGSQQRPETYHGQPWSS